MKNIKYYLAAFILVSFVYSEPTFAQTTNSISLSVNNIKSTDGKVLIALHKGEENFLGDAIKSHSVKLKNSDPVTVKFEGLEQGVYTISVVHDENDNNKLDTNFMGIPSEPYGISMDGKRMFSAPEYDKAKFELKKDLSLSISL